MFHLNAETANSRCYHMNIMSLPFRPLATLVEHQAFSLARWILENKPELPVILATGNLGKANAVAGPSGIETFAKPYDFDAAIKKIRDTIHLRNKTG